MVCINLDTDDCHETIHSSIDKHWLVEGLDPSVHEVAHWHGKL